MRRVGLLFLSAIGLFGMMGCQRDDTQVSEKLDQVLQNQKDIMAALRSGAGRGAAGMPQRGRPSPQDVFAVPVAGSPSVGVNDAKVTIVEAFDFA